MSFILVPKRGDDLQVNAWNWRPTLEFLLAENILDSETFELMGFHGSGGTADAQLATRIAEAIEHKLQGMHPGERIRADLAVTAEPKKVVDFGSSSPTDALLICTRRPISGSSRSVIFADVPKASTCFEPFYEGTPPFSPRYW